MTILVKYFMFGRFFGRFQFFFCDFLDWYFRFLRVLFCLVVFKRLEFDNNGIFDAIFIVFFLYHAIQRRLD